MALDVCFDGNKVPLELSGGTAELPEPQDNQKVTFVLRRTAEDGETYGVVLKVNGENTLYRQRAKDVLCAKWVLEPGDPPITVAGFQDIAGGRPGATAREFRVASKAESKGHEIDYGRDVGTITVTVFRALKKGAKDPANGEEDDDVLVLNRGAFPSKTPRTLAALQGQLRGDTVRGLIRDGQAVPSGVRVVKFTPDPKPVMAATIRYYKP